MNATRLNLLAVLCIYPFLFHSVGRAYDGVGTLGTRQASPDNNRVCHLIGAGFRKVSTTDPPIVCPREELEDANAPNERTSKSGPSPETVLQRLLYEIIAAAIVHFATTPPAAHRRHALVGKKVWRVVHVVTDTESDRLENLLRNSCTARPCM